MTTFRVREEIDKDLFSETIFKYLPPAHYLLINRSGAQRKISDNRKRNADLVNEIDQGFPA